MLFIIFYKLLLNLQFILILLFLNSLNSLIHLLSDPKSKYIRIIKNNSRIDRFQCREIGYETHEEILRVLDELHTTMKTYQTYQTGSRQAETKLRVAEQQRSKLEVANAPPEKLARSKKYKLMEKEVNKVG